MLRDPAETMQSKLNYYGGRSGTTRAAGWLNMMLGTEYQTRAMHRAIVRYDDLLTQWRPTLEQADRQLGIGLVDHATPEAVKEADDLIDPTLRRTSPDWAELGLAPWLQDLAQETHDAMGELAASPDGAQSTSTERMDALRATYAGIRRRVRRRRGLREVQHERGPHGCPTAYAPAPGGRSGSRRGTG